MLKKLKAILKQNKLVKYMYEDVLNKRIINVYKTDYSKNCLLSYSTLPFRQRHKFLLHPNFTENYVLADAVRKFGYNIDVYNNSYSGKIDYSKYDLLVGEGIPMSNFYVKGKNANTKVIYYATGAHPLVQNYRSMDAVLKFAQKTGSYLPNSGRMVPDSWAVSPSLADALMILGNETTKQSFDAINKESKKYTLYPPFYANNVINDFSKKSKKDFLWFGSFGLVHKDLNTVLDVFLNNPDLTLHVCGRISEEKNFMGIYDSKLNSVDNIMLHGYLSVNSHEFKKLMENCAFTILSSCSEGCSTAVATVMGNGGLIPIISRECGFTIKNGFYVEPANYDDIEKKVREAVEISDTKIIEYTKENINFVNREFSVEKYKENVNMILSTIMGGL